MRIRLQPRRFPFYVGITTLVVIIVLSLTLLFLWTSWRESTVAAVRTADLLFEQINAKVMERYENALESVAVLAESAALMPSMGTAPEGDGLSHPGLMLMLRSLAHYDYLSSLYVGFAEGRFLQVIAVRGNPEILSRFSAPEKSAFIVRTISPDAGGDRMERYSFLDSEEKVIRQEKNLHANFNPAGRPWFLKAMASGTAVYTKPYIFDLTQVPGITCSEKLHAASGVFGADITLERFRISLQRQKISPNSLLFLFDSAGRLIAHPDFSAVMTGTETDSIEGADNIHFMSIAASGDPKLMAIAAAADSPGTLLFDKTKLINIHGAPYLVRLSRMKAALRFDQILGSVAPLSDFTGHIKQMQYRTTFYACGFLGLLLPFIYVMSRRISRSMMLLEKESQKIQKFDFSESEPFDSIIKEIHSHIMAFGIMKTTIHARTEALIATQKKLEKLVQSGIALTAENNMDKLLKRIFDAARELSNADGGALYLRGSDEMLRFETMQTISGASPESGTIDKDAASVNAIPIYDPETGQENHGCVESHVALTGKAVVVKGIEASNCHFKLSEAGKLAVATEISSSIFLTVPLKPRESKTIGVMQIYNARNPENGEIMDFDNESIGFVEALAAQAAVALHNKKLLDEQRQLFDAFVQLLAGAIDAKSPYTGGHCARVPELAIMLAQAADDDGSFADFRMASDDQRREFQVAAWLHDCGKITTPEYVVDKATKLETLYNRIHEIRMRFELLLRDARIDYYQQLLAGEKDEKSLALDFDRAWRQIQEDFAFVAECNVGGEFMSDDKIERLRQIASIKWVRHLSDRIGISREESDRMAGAPEQSLPVEECLLADKPEHIVPRLRPDPFDGNRFGFRMQMPKDLYNLGEFYNLSIRKGTLTAEERFKINEHIIQTIIMLKRLPFPAYLQNVAEFAGAHHETMDGRGYPRGLKQEDMSVPARILAIADIFEALTASDRPYKKPKTLNESLRIMSFMRNDRHIDAALFDLFLKSGVYLQYAETFLDAGQIDPVDIDAYLTPDTV